MIIDRLSMWGICWWKTIEFFILQNAPSLIWKSRNKCTYVILYVHLFREVALHFAPAGWSLWQINRSFVVTWIDSTSFTRKILNVDAIISFLSFLINLIYFLIFDTIFQPFWYKFWSFWILFWYNFDQILIIYYFSIIFILNYLDIT
jgi:hypothetical protein